MYLSLTFWYHFNIRFSHFGYLPDLTRYPFILNPCAQIPGDVGENTDPTSDKSCGRSTTKLALKPLNFLINALVISIIIIIIIIIICFLFYNGRLPAQS